MTVQDVDGWVKDVADSADDCEHAHGLEDALHAAVLQEIANKGKGWPAVLAKAALKTRCIRFPRHTA